MPNINYKEVKKILIIKLRGIGDVILSTIVVRNLQTDFPNAEIHYLTEKPSNFALQANPEISKIHLFNRRSTPQQIKTIFSIRKEKFDLVFDFSASTITSLLTLLSGARYRVGYPYKGRAFGYNIFGPAERDKFHAADLHLETLKNAQISVGNKDLIFALDKSDYSFINNALPEFTDSNISIVGLSPSGGWDSKKCDPSKLAEIGNALISKYDVKVLILWGPGDHEEAIETHKLMKGKALLAPDTNIRQMAALISKCSLLIANDSGPMHISTAVGTPTLSIHGPTDPRFQGPYGEKHEWINNEELDCIICNLLECPKDHECFLQLPIEKIMDKVAKLIEKNNLNIHLISK